MKNPSPLDAVRIVMMNTSHSGNIGSAARAMRVMGIYNLTLVNPKKFPSPEATALASGALDVLDNAVVVDTIEEAIADCDYVFGTSARARHISAPPIPLDEGAMRAKERLAQNPESKIAIVFGTERTGLTNEELDHCHDLIFIPTENNYNSLNVAAAIQLICYEFRQKLSATEAAPRPAKTDKKQELATTETLEGFYEHLEETLVKIEFLDPEHSTHLMRKLRLLYNRTHLTVEEINILRGILTETQRKLSS